MKEWEEVEKEKGIEGGRKGRWAGMKKKGSREAERRRERKASREKGRQAERKGDGEKERERKGRREGERKVEKG